MAMPPGVKAKLQSRSHGGHTQAIHGARANIRNSNSVVRHSAARMVDEPTPASAAATAKILRLPKVGGTAS